MLDTSAARELGYSPVGDYATTVVEMVEWLGDSGSSPASSLAAAAAARACCSTAAMPLLVLARLALDRPGQLAVAADFAG